MVSVDSLGSTRFLKVALAQGKEGRVVVKVFVIHDPSLPLASHKDRLEGKAAVFGFTQLQTVNLSKALCALASND